MAQATTDVTHLSVLRDVESSAGIAVVHFRDGDVYAVRVISTMHAEAGDDVVVEVLQSGPASPGSPIPAGSFVNIQLGDVAEVRVGGMNIDGLA